ncbi:hypothetical protein Tco_0690092 [Tanacetum coccineum]
MCKRASAKLSSKWRFRKISMNFKAKRSSFLLIFSLFTLDGYGKVVLVLGMTTGSSSWTIGGWTSLVLPLGSTVSFVTSVSIPHGRRVPEFEVDSWVGIYDFGEQVGYVGHSAGGVDYRGGLIDWGLLLTLGSLDLTLVVAIPTVLVLVLVPTILIVGLAVVLHGGNGWSDLVWPSVAEGVTDFLAGQLRYEWAPPQVTQLCSTAFTGAGAGNWSVCLSVVELEHILSIRKHREITPEVEALVLILQQWICFGSLRNFGLAFDDA